MAKKEKKEKRHTQKNKTRNEREEITTNTVEIQRIIQEYYEKVCNTKFNNLEEMDQYLKRYNLPRPNQEELKNLNRPICSTEIEITIKNTKK